MPDLGLKIESKYTNQVILVAAKYVRSLPGSMLYDNAFLALFRGCLLDVYLQLL